DRMAVELAAVLTASRHIGAEESRVLGRGVIAITQTTAQLLQGAEGEAERETILDTMTTPVVHGLAGFPPREDSPLPGVVPSTHEATGDPGDAQTRGGTAPTERPRPRGGEKVRSWRSVSAYSTPRARSCSSPRRRPRRWSSG